MKLLLTNDDGVHADGIQALAQALSKDHTCTVVAPAAERSGASHALTMNEPLRVRKVSDGKWAVEGTPVDCVYVALHEVLEEPPDMIVSGINRGANLGDDVFYSGTVGAAREGALSGIPSLAISLDVAGQEHWASAVFYAKQVIQWMADQPPRDGVFLNLNVPDATLDKIGGLQLCRLGRRHYEPLVEKRKDPRSKSYFWIGGEPVSKWMKKGTDGWWCSQGHATLTPIGLECTDLTEMDRLKGWPGSR